MLAGGGFHVFKVQLPHASIGFAAFDMGLFASVSFQGAIIYADKSGTERRMTFKRVCRKAQSVFARTNDSGDEYSD
jgi:hypothetical protein